MMAQTSAASVPCGRRQRVSTEDRLSSLADDLLRTIMSFLGTRQAVQMSVLSRRWLGLWRSVPCLDIDQRWFYTTAADDAEDWQIEETPGDGKFANFVDNLMMLYRAPSLDAFRFHFTKRNKRGTADRCLRFGIERCPELLEISYPSSGFGYELLPLGSGTCRLRRLHLVRICLDKDFTLHLRSGCPVLEDLELERCHVGYPKLMSSTLKNLVITDCSTHWGHVLTVTAPALVSFHLVIIPVGWCWKGILLDQMPSLTEASIYLKSHPCNGRMMCHEGPFNLLSSLTNVRNLQLSGPETLWILLLGLDAFPTFPNLRTLLFNGCDMSDNLIMECFLNSAIGLEKLTLQYCNLAEIPREEAKRRGNARVICPTLCQDALAFDCPNLKSTEIRYKEADANRLFGRLSGMWRKLQKSSTIILTKV